jgi:bacterioferritin
MSRKIIDALNTALGMELGAIVQYMWHHVMVEGVESPEIAEMFRKTAIDEMKHAEKLAERIDYYGGVPTTKPGEIMIGGDMKKMIEDDLAGELTAIDTYKEFIRLAAEEGDPVTRLLLEEILTDEEDHEYNWRTLLAKKKE